MTQQTRNAEAMHPAVWNRDFVILFFVNVVSQLGFQMLNPNLAEYTTKIGIAGSITGVIVGVFSASALLSRPFAGYFTDRLNKKLLMAFSLSGIFVCFLCYIFITSPQLLVVLRILHGMFFGVNTTVSMTMVSNALPPSRLASGLGYFSIGGVASMAVAPSIGIWIAGSWGYPFLFLSGALMTGICLFLSFPLSNDGVDPPAAGNTLSIHHLFAVEAWIPAVICVLLSSICALCSSYILLLGDEKGIEGIGIYFTIYAGVLIVVRPFISRAADRIIPTHIGIPCGIFIVAAMLTLWYARNLTLIIIAAVLFGIGYSVMPLLQSMCIQSVSKERRGVASSTYFMGMDIGFTFGPVAGGMLSVAIGYANTFFCFSMPAILGIAVMAGLNRNETRNKNILVR